jgi:hypothetical protein
MAATLDFDIGPKTLRGPHEERCGPRMKSHGVLDDYLTLELFYSHGAPLAADLLIERRYGQSDTGAAG